ncbi:MAG: Asp23/Gls24 family envelope stress response protein [bacterium]|nr:Asp23/Gls24 family envelope stress response protein [bacterium]
MPEEIKSGLGTATISDEVVGAIAGLAASEVRGVAGMSEGMVDGIARIISRSQIGKGVKVEVGKKEAALDLAIVVDYGPVIPNVVKDIQENIKNRVETITGLKVVEVNVRVDGIKMPEEEKALPSKRVK